MTAVIRFTQAMVSRPRYAAMSVEHRGRYALLMRAVIAQAQSAMPNAVPAAEAGRVVANAIASKRPRTRYTVGRDAAIIVRLAKHLSDGLLDRLLARALKPHLRDALPDR